VAFLAAKPLDLAHRHAFYADFAEGVLHFFEFERFNNRFDFLHIFFIGWLTGSPSQSHCPRSPAPQASAARNRVWLCLAHAAFSNGNANRENNPARVEKRSDLFEVFEEVKKFPNS
jgi:hypothetical protein